MSECTYYQELISRKLDEALSTEEEAALADHLRVCPDCAVMAEAFASLSRSLSEELEEAPEALCVNVMSQLHREDIRKKNHRRSHRTLRLALSAAACLALLLVGGAGLRPMLSQNNAAAVQAETKARPDRPKLAPKEALAGGTAVEEAAPAEAPAAMAVPEAYSVPAEPQANHITADQAPAEEMEAGYDGGVMLFSAAMSLPRGDNRPPLLWEELDELLDGTHSAQDLVLPEEPVLVLTVDLEGVYQDVAFYEQESGLCYRDPADGQLKESGCSVEQLQQFAE